MLSLLKTSKLIGKEYDRDSYDINRAAKDIADKTRKAAQESKNPPR